MSRQFRGLALFALLGLVLLAPSHQASAQCVNKHAEPSCCQMSGHDKTDCVMVQHRCPLKPAEATQCCASCLPALALIDFSNVAFVFDDGVGEILTVKDLDSSSRSTRPPYPPPRSS